MNRISRYMQNYLLYGFAFVIVQFVWSGLFTQPSVHAGNSALTTNLYELLSLNVLFWILTLVLYMVFLVVIPSVRYKTLRRLANLKERDEREEYITAKAARSSYIATLSLSLFFLFFSLFSFNISKVHKTDPQTPGHTASISFHYTVFNDTKVPTTTNNQATTIFDTYDYSPSNTTLIVILLAWQLLVFNFVARRESMKAV